MRLVKLRLENFQGIERFTIQPEGKSVLILGDNGTGKTTIANAFSWLLFGKDSLGQAQFEIKPLKADGSVLHGLTTEVEAVFANAALRKTYAEKYTKRRGSAQAELTGHVIDHYVDGVPVKAGEFSAKVASLCDESLFKLITNPRYFNEQLHWQKRREALLDICGDVSDTQVIESDAALSDLPGILGGRKLEDQKRVLSATKDEINKQLAEIPARIDEANRGKIDVPLSAQEIGTKVAIITDTISSKRKELASIQAGGELAEKRKALAEIEAQLLDISNRQAFSEQQARQEAELKLSTLRRSAAELEIEINSASRLNGRDASELASIETELASLREAFLFENGREFEYADQDVCPTCKQSLPVEQVQEAREKALADFNTTKAETLKAVNAKGKEISARKKAIETQIATRNEALSGDTDKLVKLKKQIETLSVVDADFVPDPEKEKLVAGQLILKDAIAQLEQTPDQAANDLHFSILALEQEKAGWQAKLAALDANKKADQRIEALKKQERDLARQFEENERQLHLCELFTRRKVFMLTDRINAQFELARWKLFDEQINGGITECCDCTVNGVPYNSLNNGTRTNAGLDIINTLCRHHNVNAPIFIDNAEAVTQLLHTDSQQIRLIVSANHPTLTIGE